MPRRRFGKKLLKSFLPIVLVLVLALALALGAIVYNVSRPPRRAYLVTPQSFQLISSAVLKVTDETWRNTDGTKARGWLLKGSEGAPAVVLLHHYGADRSWLFNLGVKLNEATNATILWPDLRGHGMNPPVNSTTFGSSEGDDVIAALTFLRNVKTEGGKSLVGDRVGLYGVELGAYAALSASTKEAVSVMVLDSVPRAPDELLRAAIKENFGFDNDLLQYLARMATQVYLLGKYKSVPACTLASQTKSQRALLLSGADAGYLRSATNELARCFPSTTQTETRADLPLTGLHLSSATGEQGEGYDRGVIEFFDRNLR